MKRYKILLLITVMLMALPLVSSSIDTTFLMNYWDANANSYDDIHNGFCNLTQTAPAASYTNGILEEAMDISSGGHYNCSDHPIYDSMNKEFTWTAWINTTSSIDRGGLFFHGDNDEIETKEGWFLEYRSNHTIRMQLDSDSGTFIWNFPSDWNDEKWTYLSVVYKDGLISVYKNGTLLATHSGGGASIESPNQNPSVGCLWDNDACTAALRFDGQIDEIAYFNISLNQANITELYNNGVGLAYPLTVPGPSTDSINLSNPLPSNFSDFNELPISVNVSGNFSFNATCKLILRDTVNKTVQLSAGQNQFFNWTYTALDDGAYNYTINCTDNQTSEVTVFKTFFFDTTFPALVHNFTNNSFWYLENLTALFNASDNIILESFNLSLDGNIVHYNDSIDTGSYEFYLNYNMSNLSIGKHELFIEVKDGHTAKKLKNKDDYYIGNGFFNDYLEYDIKGSYKPTKIKMYSDDDSIFDDWSASYNTDRFQETFYPYHEKAKQKFIVESDRKIKIIEHEGLYGGKWLVIGNHWKDFVLEGEDNITIDILQINDYKVKVTIDGIQNQDKLTFKSTGDLNIFNLTLDFYAINFTETFDKLVFTGFSFDVNLTVHFGELEFNLSDFDLGALLDYNSTNYTASQTFLNTSQAEFQYVFPANFDASINGSVPHLWHFNATNLTIGYDSTDIAYQARHDIKIDECDGGNINYPIVNFTYTDELTDDMINVTNAYQLKINDGTYFYNQTDFFNESHNHTLCTNINPSNTTYNWNAWGSLILTKSGFVTRIITIDEASPYVFSNNPMTTINLFMIGTANSTTMTYNWLTTNFELIQGTMRIFRCLDNGSTDLIESVPVISGVAYANIQLLLQPYSYDITIDGTTYEDEDGFSLCHTEAVTEVTYFVDTSEIDLSALVGLSSINCRLEKITNETVQMTWDVNPEQSGYVQGCILAYRRFLTGLTEVYNNCSVEAEGYNRTVAIPINGNEYIVRAELRQGGNVVTCDEEVSFFVGRAASELFSLTGLFGAFLLILGISLMYAGLATQQLIGAAVGLVAAFMLALVNVSWITISSLILILVLVGIVGRLSRVE